MFKTFRKWWLEWLRDCAEDNGRYHTAAAESMEKAVHGATHITGGVMVQIAHHRGYAARYNAEYNRLKTKLEGK